MLASRRGIIEETPEVELLRARIRLAAAIVLSAGILAVAMVPGHAQQKKQDDVRKRGQIACGGDVDKLCATLKGQSDPVVLQCLQQAKADLGDTCRKFLTEVGQLD
jgi:hypothetical protein